MLSKNKVSPSDKSSEQVISEAVSELENVLYDVKYDDDILKILMHRINKLKKEAKQMEKSIRKSNPFVYNILRNQTVKDESLGLVSVSRLRAARLSVSSRSRSNYRGWSRLGLVS